MPKRKKTKRGKATKSSDHDKVLKYLTDRKGDNEQYHTKIIAGHIKKQYKDERPIKVIYNSVRQSLKRHHEDGEIQKYKKGRDTFWNIPDIETVDEQVDELEKHLSSMIEMDSVEPPPFHNIHFYLKKENCDKTEAPLSDTQKTMFNAMHPGSMYQAFAKRNVTQIRGGVQEKFDYKGSTVTIQCFGTGKVNISVNCSEHPMGFEEVLFFEEWLDALLLSITGFGFRENQDITTVCWEWAIDREVESDEPVFERHDLSGKYAITVRQFDDMVSRIYLKHFKDGSIKERTEQVINKEITYPEWLRGSSVMFGGGVNQQFIIRQQFQHEKEMERLAKGMETRDNAILMNQALIRKMGLDTEYLTQSVEKLAEELGVKLPKRKNAKEDEET